MKVWYIQRRERLEEQVLLTRLAGRQAGAEAVEGGVAAAEAFSEGGLGGAVGRGHAAESHVGDLALRHGLGVR